VKSRGSTAVTNSELVDTIQRPEGSNTIRVVSDSGGVLARVDDEAEAWRDWEDDLIVMGALKIYGNNQLLHPRDCVETVGEEVEMDVPHRAEL